MEKLNINGLKVSINNKTILNDISFTLPKGETLIIIGESGSGKTMLSKLLIGIKPDNASINGNIFFDEKDLLKISEKEWNEYRGKKFHIFPKILWLYLILFKMSNLTLWSCFKAGLAYQKKNV